MSFGKRQNEILSTLQFISGLVHDLQNCDCEEEVQFEALRSPFKEIQYACVKNPYAKEAVLLEALDLDDTDLRLLVASNTSATEAVLLKALDDSSLDVKVAAAKNSSATDTVLLKAITHHEGNDSAKKLKYTALSNPSATEAFLLKILEENLLDQTDKINLVLDNPAATNQVYIKAISHNPYAVLLNPKYISETIYLAATKKLSNCRIMFIKGYLARNGELVFRVNNAITPAVLSKAFDNFADKIICSYTYEPPHNALFLNFLKARVTVGYVVYHHPNSTEELKHRAEPFKNSISFHRASERIYTRGIEEL